MGGSGKRQANGDQVEGDMAAQCLSSSVKDVKSSCCSGYGENKAMKTEKKDLNELPKINESYAHTKAYTIAFRVTLSKTAKSGNPRAHQLVMDKQVWSIHTTEHYPAIKKEGSTDTWYNMHVP